MKVRCDYCNRKAALVNGAIVYPHRPDLASSQFWYCADCSAWVGVHPGTTKPLGRLATAKLRQLKSMAHAAFDPIWKSKRMKRGQAYAWLAKEMGLPRELTHIGMFDEDQCAQVAKLAHGFMRGHASQKSTYMGRTPCKVLFNETERIELSEGEWIWPENQ